MKYNKLINNFDTNRNTLNSKLHYYNYKIKNVYDTCFLYVENNN